MPFCMPLTAFYPFSDTFTSPIDSTNIARLMKLPNHQTNPPATKPAVPAPTIKIEDSSEIKLDPVDRVDSCLPISESEISIM